MNTPADKRPTETTVSAYEQLRARILDPHLRVNGELGLSVLLRQGLLAWTRTYSALLSEVHTSAMRLDSTRVSASLHHEIIDVMVAMATCPSRSFHPGALSR
jgi:hypothetical protein